MEELLTFTTFDNKYKFTVKNEFVKLHPEYVNKTTFKLLTEYKVINYLHNPHGPAIVRLSDNRQEYWMDGKKCTEEEAKVISHKEKFDKKFFETIDKS